MEEKVKDLVKRDTLCSNNLLVKHFLNLLKRKLKKLGVTDPEVYTLVNDGLETLRIMKKQGQRIEDRTRKYHNSIIALGFQRVKNKRR